MIVSVPAAKDSPKSGKQLVQANPFPRAHEAKAGQQSFHHWAVVDSL